MIPTLRFALRALPSLAIPLLFAACATAPAPPPVAANDFPTVDRVLYVQDCMRVHPGPFYEMVNKCSCAADAMAAEVRYDEFVTMQTISNGMSIGGERGGAIRDVPSLAPELKKYRALQTKVQSSCFIKSDAK